MIESSESNVGAGPVLRVSWREPLLGALGYFTFNDYELTDRTRFQVNVANQNLLVHGADVQLPGVAGTDLGINRYYNSRGDTTTRRAGAPGIGWHLDVGQDVRFSMTGGMRHGYFEGPSGYQVVFPFNASTGLFEQPAGLNASVVHNAPGTNTHDYTVTFHDSGLKYHFAGREALTSIEDTSGNRITMHYTGTRVTSITDTKGGVTTLAYGSNNRVATITDPFGRTATYGYDSLQNLTSVTDQAGATTTYSYDADHNLTAITDPNGNTTRFAYSTDDHLRTISWADSTPANPVTTTYAEPWGWHRGSGTRTVAGHLGPVGARVRRQGADREVLPPVLRGGPELRVRGVQLGHVLHPERWRDGDPGLRRVQRAIHHR